MSSLIELHHATKIYQTGNSAFHALKSVNLAMQSGEMIAIVGASGSGKSTLMNILGFLDHCDSGHYYFKGQDVSRLNDEELAIIRNQNITFVFQAFFLLPRLNALQNVMLPLSYRGMNKAQAEPLAMAMLERVGMKSFYRQKPNQLSGGQQQRVAIARALVGSPDIIFADEPTGALDSQTGNEVMQLLCELNKEEQRTIVIVTHDHDVSRQCQRIITIKDGQILS